MQYILFHFIFIEFIVTMYKREHKFFGGCLTGFAIFVLKMYAEAFCPSEALHSSDFLKVGKKTKQMQAALSQYLCNRQKCPPSWPSMVSGSRLCQETVCQFVLFQILIFFGHNTFLFISTTHWFYTTEISDACCHCLCSSSRKLFHDSISLNALSLQIHFQIP